jgi:hypothetical protein
MIFIIAINTNNAINIINGHLMALISFARASGLSEFLITDIIIVIIFQATNNVTNPANTPNTKLLHFKVTSNIPSKFGKFPNKFNFITYLLFIFILIILLFL